MQPCGRLEVRSCVRGIGDPLQLPPHCVSAGQNRGPSVALGTKTFPGNSLYNACRLVAVVVKDIAICEGGLGFDFRFSQSGHSVANGSLP